MDDRFSWDAAKAARNQEKHGVTFAEATTVFAHPFAVIFDDTAHSTPDELREIIIGYTADDQLLLVAFTERAARIRIISARRATPKERRAYERGAFP